MTSHELARRLLEEPDRPVTLMIECAHDTVSSADEDQNPVEEISTGENKHGVYIRAYVEETHFGYIDD